jgi:hypothetical protein
MADIVSGQDVDVLSLPALPSGTNTIGKVARVPATTATLSSVNDTASTTTLVLSNANRIGLSIFNDSSKILYVKFGATASTTSFTVRMGAQAFYEMPEPIYTGIIDGIWSADSTGAARITEIT